MEVLNYSSFVFGPDLWNQITERIHAGDGILITIIGLSAVFTGLIFLWIVTSFLPALIAKYLSPADSSQTAYQGQSDSDQSALGQNESDRNRELATAIAVALCCELEDEEVSVLTLRHIEQEMSPWVVASRPTTMRHS